MTGQLVRDKLQSVVTAWESRWFGDADPRAYALVRIGIGTVCFATVWHLWPMRSELLGPYGLLDPNIVSATNDDPLKFSIFFFVHSEAVLTAIFAAAAVVSVALTVGLFSHSAALLLWIFTVSISNRAYMMTSGGDQLLRCFLFLLVISPLARAWSLDAMRRDGGANPPLKDRFDPVPRYGLTLMQLQVFVVYYQTMWLKLPDQYWRNGELMSYFMMSMYSRYPTPRVGALGGALECSYLRDDGDRVGRPLASVVAAGPSSRFPPGVGHARQYLAVVDAAAFFGGDDVDLFQLSRPSRF